MGELSGYYIVEEGTNQLWSTGKNPTPRIYDTEKIAQEAIDREDRKRARWKLPRSMKLVPISIAEYNKKYIAGKED